MREGLSGPRGEVTVLQGGGKIKEEKTVRKGSFDSSRVAGKVGPLGKTESGWENGTSSRLPLTRPCQKDGLLKTGHSR